MYEECAEYIALVWLNLIAVLMCNKVAKWCQIKMTININWLTVDIVSMIEQRTIIAAAKQQH
ncbi:hypothetical protein T10_10974 [Trichinella papuae]|uniref:Uncharacterized protein n=1 Tax=Trichinella papuae TaxID=268474 RepID=A0A0V1MKW3_9BILA|nr:hypothetical protein T10_10974 [Trichinella papuae]